MWGYINKSGEWQIHPKFYWAGAFEGGIAAVEALGSGGSSRGWALRGLINKKGEYIVKPFQFGSYVFPDSGGLAEVQRARRILWITSWFTRINRGWFLADGRGRYLNWKGYERIGEYSEGLIPVERGGKWGFVDVKGKMVIKPAYDWAYRFSEGLAPVEIDARKDGKWIFVDNKPAGSWVYIDKSGKQAIPKKFKQAEEFHDGRAFVKFKEDSDKWAIVDHNGKTIIPPTYDNSLSFREQRAFVKLN
ncbi:MAG: WG repeat-containing protein, partial [bacterium]